MSLGPLLIGLSMIFSSKVLKFNFQNFKWINQKNNNLIWFSMIYKELIISSYDLSKEKFSRSSVLQS